MSQISTMLTYSWSNTIRGSPFEIQVFAHNVEEARQEVFAVLDEVVRNKPEYEALDKEYGDISDKYYNEWRKSASCPQGQQNPVLTPLSESMDKLLDQMWDKSEPEGQQNPVLTPLSENMDKLLDQMRNVCERVPANFFNGCFATSSFNYTPDMIIGSEGMTLAEFISNTEPICGWPVRKVSFRSCLDS
jgi:hypothetical protein